MNRDEAFLQDLRERPDDDLTRLAYADWLEEHDDPRGRYLRVEVELARLTEDVGRYATLEAELQGLRGQIEPAWVEGVGKRYDVVLHSLLDPARKIWMIKLLRELLSIGLKEGKDLVEGRHPTVLLEGVSRQQGEQAREHLRYSQGEKIAEVELRVNNSGRRVSGPVAAPAPAAAQLGPFDLYLHSYPPENKIFAIKVIRELTGIGLKEAKDLSEAPLPVKVVAGLTREQADAAAARFEDRAVVEVRDAAAGPPTAAPPRGPLRGLLAPLSPAAAHDLYLCSYDFAYKINVIKAIREVTGLGLREAKDLSEAPLPVCIAQGLSGERVAWAVARFEGKATLEARAGGASVPITGPAAPAAAAGGQALVLKGYDVARKIDVIRAIREWTGLGLREAKDLSEAKLPVVVCQGLSPARAVAALRAFGAVADVELRPAGS